MARWILRFTGEGAKSAEDVEVLCRSAGATVLDPSPPRMVLVEAEESALRAALENFPAWVMSPEQPYSLPPTSRTACQKDLRPPE